MTDQALAVIPEEQSTAIFDTKSPIAVITRATDIANQLAPLVEKAHLYSMISGRKYVKVEGWVTMLAMLGVFPHVEYCRKRESDVTEYEARVELRTIDGKAVGSGEALCSAVERNWSGRDEFAIKSMAQTRATGKAARNAFSWIMALAGYEATPAEEMPHDDSGPSNRTQPPLKSNPRPLPNVVKARITASEGEKLAAAAKSKGLTTGAIARQANVQRLSEITVDQLPGLMKWIELQTLPKEIDKEFDAVFESLIRAGVANADLSDYIDSLGMDRASLTDHLKKLIDNYKKENLPQVFLNKAEAVRADNKK